MVHQCLSFKNTAPTASHVQLSKGTQLDNINKQITHRNCTRYIFQCFSVKPSKNSFHCCWLTIGIWRFKRQVKVVPLYIKIFGWMMCLKRLLGRSIDSSNWGSISQECFLSALAESSNHPSSYLLTIRALDLWQVGNSSHYYCTRPELRCLLRCDSFCWTTCFTVFCCHILLTRRCPNQTYSERGLTNHNNNFQDCQDMAKNM